MMIHHGVGNDDTVLETGQLEYVIPQGEVGSRIAVDWRVGTGLQDAGPLRNIVAVLHALVLLARCSTLHSLAHRLSRKSSDVGIPVHIMLHNIQNRARVLARVDATTHTHDQLWRVILDKLEFVSTTGQRPAQVPV